MRYYIEEDTSTTPPTLVKVPIDGSFINYNTAPIGSIQQYSGTSLPPGWLWCNGAAYSRQYFPFLFKVIGTTYGTGDGSTTFNVPSIPDLATGIKYVIKAYSTADAKDLGIDPGEVYTTTETKVGTWIDGKPIYRKVFVDTIGATSGGSRTLSTGIPSGVVDDVITLKAMFKDTDSRTYWWSTDYAEFQVTPGDLLTVNIYLNNNGTDFAITNLGNWPATSRMTIILEYTKV